MTMYDPDNPTHIAYRERWRRERDFWDTDTYKIVQAMKATGNQPGLIQRWKDMVERMALNMEGSDALALRAWLPLWQTRPAYTATELAPIFPALSLMLGYTTRLPAQKSPLQLASELAFAKLPHRYVGSKLYYIVERLHHWPEVSQKDFENALNG